MLVEGCQCYQLSRSNAAYDVEASQIMTYILGHSNVVIQHEVPHPLHSVCRSRHEQVEHRSVRCMAV